MKENDQGSEAKKQQQGELSNIFQSCYTLGSSSYGPLSALCFLFLSPRMNYFLLHYCVLDNEAE